MLSIWTASIRSRHILQTCAWELFDSSFQCIPLVHCRQISCVALSLSLLLFAFAAPLAFPRCLLLLVHCLLLLLFATSCRYFIAFYTCSHDMSYLSSLSWSFLFLVLTSRLLLFDSLFQQFAYILNGFWTCCNGTRASLNDRSIYSWDTVDCKWPPRHTLFLNRLSKPLSSFAEELALPRRVELKAPDCTWFAAAMKFKSWQKVDSWKILMGLERRRQLILLPHLGYPVPGSHLLDIYGLFVYLILLSPFESTYWSSQNFRRIEVGLTGKWATNRWVTWTGA